MLKQWLSTSVAVAAQDMFDPTWKCFQWAQLVSGVACIQLIKAEMFRSGFGYNS